VIGELDPIIKAGETVVCWMEKGTIRITISPDGKSLDLMSLPAAGVAGKLAIEPRVANAIRVKVI